MISIVLKLIKEVDKPQDKRSKGANVVLFVLEELMFWSGWLTIFLGTGVVFFLGVFLLFGSVIFAFKAF